MATKRKSMTKKTRFEVFKRDGFKCQYCGACSPEAILVVDHINPISKDGADDMMNYITACQPCNAGKSDRRLDDSTTLQKQRAQLAELSDRREQLEMLMQWRKGLKNVSDMEIDVLTSAWSEAAVGWSLNDQGLKQARLLVKKYGLNAALDAIELVRVQYVKLDANGKAIHDSVNLAWSKVGGVLRLSAMPQEKRELYYVKGILRNRFSRIPYDLIQRLDAAHESGISIEDLKLEAKHQRSWSSFCIWLDQAQEAADGAF